MVYNAQLAAANSSPGSLPPENNEESSDGSGDGARTLACHRSITTARADFMRTLVCDSVHGTRVFQADTLGVALQGFFRHQHGAADASIFRFIPAARGRYGSAARHKLTSDD